MTFLTCIYKCFKICNPVYIVYISHSILSIFFSHIYMHRCLVLFSEYVRFSYVNIL